MTTSAASNWPYPLNYQSLIAAFVLAWTCGVTAPAPARAVIHESGRLIEEVERIRGLGFPSGSDLYDAPSSSQRNAFRNLAHALEAGDLPVAQGHADALDYDLVAFTDTDTGNLYYLLREQLVAGEQTRGWGSYILNPDPARNVLVQSPHALFERNTNHIAIRTFLNTGAFGFLMNGAHRNANGTGSADVAALNNSIFQEVHKAWVDAVTPRTAVQIHGWDNDNDRHDHFPSDARIVISNGDGQVNPHAILMDAAFDALGLTSYVYNELPPDSAINLLVNGGVDGDTFHTLAATQNEQGKHARSVGASFLHVEIELAVRQSTSNTDKTVAALTDAINQMTPIPEPTTILLLATGALSLPRRQR